MSVIRLQHFDDRRVWATYSGRKWLPEHKAHAIHDARKFYNSMPHVCIGGVRLVDMVGRVLWSIAAEPTFRLEIDRGDGEGFQPLWGEWAMSRWDAEHGHDHHAGLLGKPIRIVPEDYPRESAQVERVDVPAFSAPEPPKATGSASHRVPAVTFSYGGPAA
ncbi:hypothetical protein [Streptomyces sp. NPDC059080]|uniref:hypothetical protein n=1 Tax=Streptomyces sp. NPDC059080 TaxID=3346718 RepID=UPI00369DBBDF